MSISDQIVVMKQGVIQQTGKPQEVYDDPVNLFVARFLGTPPINVFRGSVQAGRLYIGDAAVLTADGIPDREVWVGIRPEGFIPDAQGALECSMSGIEVMGRDISVVSTHPCAQSPVIRSIVNAENNLDPTSPTVRFSIKPSKTFMFDLETEKRIRFGL